MEACYADWCRGCFASVWVWCACGWWRKRKRERLKLASDEGNCGSAARTFDSFPIVVS